MVQKCQSKDPSSCTHPNCPANKSSFNNFLDSLKASIGILPKKVQEGPSEPIERPRSVYPLPKLDEEIETQKKVTQGNHEWAHHWLSDNGRPVAFVKTHMYETDGETEVVICDLEVRDENKGYARAALEALKTKYGVEHMYTTGTATEKGRRFVQANYDILQFVPGEPVTKESFKASVEPMTFVRDWDSRSSEFNL